MKLSDIATTTTRVTVSLGGDAEVWVDFRPQAVTPQLIAGMASAEQSGDAGQAALNLAAVVCAVVAGWDLQEDDGRMVELTPDRVAALPLFVLQHVLAATKDAVTVGEAKPATSDVG